MNKFVNIFLATSLISIPTSIYSNNKITIKSEFEKDKEIFNVKENPNLEILNNLRDVEDGISYINNTILNKEKDENEIDNTKLVIDTIYNKLDSIKDNIINEVKLELKKEDFQKQYINQIKLNDIKSNLNDIEIKWSEEKNFKSFNDEIESINENLNNLKNYYLIKEVDRIIENIKNFSEKPYLNEEYYLLPKDQLDEKNNKKNKQNKNYSSKTKKKNNKKEIANSNKENIENNIDKKENLNEINNYEKTKDEEKNKKDIDTVSTLNKEEKSNLDVNGENKLISFVKTLPFYIKCIIFPIFLIVLLIILFKHYIIKKNKINEENEQKYFENENIEEKKINDEIKVDTFSILGDVVKIKVEHEEKEEENIEEIQSTTEYEKLNFDNDIEKELEIEEDIEKFQEIEENNNQLDFENISVEDFIIKEKNEVQIEKKEYEEQDIKLNDEQVQDEINYKKTLGSIVKEMINNKDYNQIKIEEEVFEEVITNNNLNANLETYLKNDGNNNLRNVLMKFNK